ncbi:MAG TPA: EF-hand domain-containing protein [Hyphomonadaceae bacterium]|jgi:Ca2+-binding EF-hand superfamily protein|nr:EF-hand domain-containing protein [Hyphomonadaceae bacterium]
MTKYLLLAATAIALASPALAQQGGGRPQQTPEERAAAFVKADANKDGKLDKAELKMTLPEQFQAQVDDERLGQMLARRDTDKDGFISKAEYDAPMAPRAPQ